MNLKHITVLLVEDELTCRIAMLKTLSTYGFKEIFTAFNGEDGLEKYYQRQPDIIITNYDMPLMDGLKMSKKVKKNNPDIPIILTTAITNKSTIIQAINNDIDGYLFKPLDFKQLEFLIKKHCKRIVLQRNFKKEQKLLEEYKGAIDASSAVTKTDMNGVITYVNDSFCKLSGYSKKELLGKKHNILRHQDTQLGVYIDMWKTITDKKVWQGRMKNRKKNGDTYYEYSVIAPILSEDDDIEEYIAFRQDITDLYHHEQYLKKRITEEVDRNLQLHKEKEDARLLEEKFSTIGKMAAGITHEINTPLTYVKGNLELMLQDINSLDDGLKQKKYLQEDSKIIFDGVNRIASIVESMREMASRTKEISKPHNIYSSLLTALTLAYNKSKFISNITLQGEVFSIGMDKNRHNFTAPIQKQRIEQLFIIIINNAIDALNLKGDFDSRLFEITIENEDKYVLIKFQDNAGGIDKDILPKIFDPFQSNKEEGGIGIGLNVAKRIVEDHNGKIIPSNIKEGALFEVYLPLQITPKKKDN